MEAIAILHYVIKEKGDIMKINLNDCSEPTGNIRHKFSNYSDARSVAGIYCLIDSSDEVVYIGESIDVKNRLSQHYSGDGNKCVYSLRDSLYFYANYGESLSDEDTRKRKEAKLIDKYNPKCND